MTSSPKDTQSRRDWMALAAILALAVALRIIGLRWGLPNELHSYSYHPDEFLTVGSSAHMAGLIDGHRTINPGFYNYPSLYLYLSSLAMMVANGYGWLAGDQNIYLPARMTTVLMSTGSVAAVYWAGRTTFGATAGLLAALVMAIAPIHVQHSHFATVDVPSTLPVALCLGYAALILKRGSWRDYILAGIMAGLACGTKYNAVLVIFAPIAAHFLSDAYSGASSRLKATILNPKLYLIPIVAMAAFIISTPGSLLYSSEFLSAINYERLHQSVGHGLVFVGTGNGFWYTFRSSLWFGFGSGFAVMFVVAALWGVISRNRRALTLLAFVLPYYVLISVSEVRFARYALPLLPAAAILVGWLIQDLYVRLTQLDKPFARLALVIVCLFIMLGNAVYTAILLPCDGDDARNLAARQILSTIPKGASIGFLSYPWFYSPPISKNLGFGTLPQRKEAAANSPYRIVVFNEQSPGSWWTGGNPPQWVIVSDYETQDANRLAYDTTISAADKKQVTRILGDMDLILKNYSCRYRYRGLQALGLLPHDMRYTMPAITVYELKH